MTNFTRLQVLHVIGTRPNIPKFAPVYRALREFPIDQRVLHTGQHYDPALAADIFDDLEIPLPDVQLRVGSGTQGRQTARILEGVEDHMLATPYDAVIVYGDVNSSVGAALVAAKLGVKVIHVESGLRSGDMRMPEEVNRVVIDRLSDLLLTTSRDGDAHLVAEGIASERIKFVGNPMIDSLFRVLPKARSLSVAQSLGISGKYAIATVHRPSNVDSDEAARTTLAALESASHHIPLLLPLHPRGRERLMNLGLRDMSQITVVDPLPYLRFMSVLAGASLVITDSGGIQEETTSLHIPCLTVRENTERPVTITHGTNKLVAMHELADAVAAASASPESSSRRVPELWDGSAGQRIAETILEFLN